MSWSRRFIVAGGGSADERCAKVGAQFASLEQEQGPFGSGAVGVVRGIGGVATAAVVALEAGPVVVETNGHIGSDGRGNFTLSVTQFTEATLPAPKE